MENELKAYNVIRSILSMLNESNKRAVSFSTARQAVALVAQLSVLLPEDNYEATHHLQRIATATSSLQGGEDEYLTDNAKQILIDTFRNFKQALACNLFDHFSVNEFELTDANKATFRSIVSMHELGEEFDG